MLKYYVLNMHLFIRKMTCFFDNKPKTNEMKVYTYHEKLSMYQKAACYRYESIFVDVEECSDVKGGCEQNCINADGSFKCSCNDGYRQSVLDNKQCRGI